MSEFDRQAITDEPKSLGFSDYLKVLRRRIWYLLLPAVLTFVVALTVALLLPATYRSTATILIEQQPIPPGLVSSNFTGFADQQVKTISQRVLNTADLSKAIEKYDLFREERKKSSLTSLVGAMRRGVTLDLLDAKVEDRRSGGSNTAATTFSVSFEHASPTVAQQAADALASLFLNENRPTRQDAARGTSVFLTAEADRWAETIADLEAKVASFKEEHGYNLPAMQPTNRQHRTRIQEQLKRNALEARLLDQRIVLLESELARTPSHGDGDAAATNTGVSMPKDRLMQLELQYVDLTTRLKANHPDLLLLEREMATLQQQTGGLDVADLETLLANARATLAERQERWADSHPDVKGAQRAVASLEERLRTAQVGASKTTGSLLPENPAYPALVAQLEAVRAERDHLRQQKSDLTADLAAYEQRVKEAPKIGREFDALTRDYENAVNRFREIKAKQEASALAESRKNGRQTERFVLIEPARVPDEPIKPNRTAIVILGAILSLGVGLGTTALRELMSPGIYGSRAVIAIAGAPPMAVIPSIETKQEAVEKRRRKWLFAAAILLLVGGIVVMHLFVRPLNLAAFQIMQRLDLVQPSGGS